jgi:hypothetical protein
VVSLVSGRPDQRQQLPPLQAARGLGELTSLSLTLSANSEPSAELEALCSAIPLTLVSGTSPMIELRFDGAQKGESHDLRPTLPMVISQ